MKQTDKELLVLAVLQESDKPLSAYALLDQLHKSGFKAPTQVYRVLKRLTKQGLVHRLGTLNAYVECVAPNTCSHGSTAFVICDLCGRVEESTDSNLNQYLSSWMQNNAFSLHHPTIEIHGTCAACASLTKTGS